MDEIRGRAWTFGDDLNTDVLHPPAFFSLDPDVVRRGLFHGLDPTLQPRLAPGDVIVAGSNFGCGSSRETSVQSLRLNQIGAIVAVDFARIFFRSATNNGLPCLTFLRPDDRARVRTGQTVTLSPGDWHLRTDAGDALPLEPPGPFIERIWRAGGLLGLLPDQRAPSTAGQMK